MRETLTPYEYTYLKFIYISTHILANSIRPIYKPLLYSATDNINAIVIGLTYPLLYFKGYIGLSCRIDFEDPS